MSKKKEFIPEYRTQFVSGTFVDYAGNTRNYTMCAVSIPSCSMFYNGYGTGYGEKILSIGVSVCSASDNVNPELGQRIAYGKAVTPRSMDHLMLVTHGGMINTIVVDALLRQESAHFEKDPGTYIKGYNQDKKRYIETGRVATAEQYMGSDVLPKPSDSLQTLAASHILK